jgi:2-polyprenyl-3-methyl-5-hydroxy-6-metoxy-1,4-benzoquinol methylase
MAKQFLKDWPTELYFTKLGVKYHKDQFGTLHSKSIDQTDMVGGGFAVERNSAELNTTRLQRIKEITGTSNPYVLDYGCGQGQMLYFLRNKGIKANGYDPYNPEFNFLYNVKYDCITMIEVVEHLSYPFPELSGVHLLLKEGGKVMIETSFSDWLTKDDAYIDPKVGHCTIWSHAGLDHFMQLAGFKVGNHINRNVRIYEK